MNDKVVNVLYVDDETNNLNSFKAEFRKNFNVFTAGSAKEAEPILAKHIIHVLITDQRMPETLGTELLSDAVKKYPYQTRILLSAYVEDDMVKESEMRGLIYAAIGKPWDADLLKKYIEEGYDIFYHKVAQQQLVLKLKQTEKNSRRNNKKR